MRCVNGWSSWTNGIQQVQNDENAVDKVEQTIGSQSQQLQSDSVFFPDNIPQQTSSVNIVQINLPSMAEMVNSIRTFI